MNPTLSLSLALALLIGCRNKDDGPKEKDSGGTAPVGETDRDGDGFTESDGDCDDYDASVSPEAEEVCDGVDNNCNDEIDEGVQLTLYADTDGDGYGDDANTREDCTAGDGWVEAGGDCAPTDAESYPGAAERCDGVDNDCDGTVDNDIETEWYLDADGDGFGDAGSTIESCDPDPGYVANADDCDDASPESYPDAPEICDELDNDCDTEVDEGVTTTFYADADLDGEGDAAGLTDTALTTQACDTPEGYAANADDCDDTDADVNTLATEVCDGVDNDCDGSVDPDTAADAQTFYADADADGYGDALAPTTACEAPSGHVADDTDCDDGDDAINPGATEVCDAGSVDEDCDGVVNQVDADIDGFISAECGGDDCDDSTAAVSPSATETWYDGTDSDCDGASDYDADGDGVDSDAFGGTDCDDAAATTFPGATDAWYDGVDADCAGDSDFDADADGYDSDAFGGDDCDDTAVAVSPAAAETWYDGTDSDCDGASDYDADGDGFDADSYGGDDCDDASSAVSPAATEIYYDGFDQNCDGASDYDKDADGFDSIAYGGDDCADLNPYRFPGATERWYDGIDQDCAGDDDYDADADGDRALSAGGTDCDDTEPLAYGGATEVCGDGVDNDCDGTAENVDADGDGYTPVACGGGDCADGNPARNPGATEVWYDGIDQDCDGADDDDADGDGFQSNRETSDGTLGTDCNDRVAAMYPGNTEVANDGYDNDCDGVADGTGPQGLASDFADLTITGDAVERLSQGDPGFAAAGDLNGDGRDDFIAGAIFDGTVATRSGAAYVVFGPLSAGSATTINTIADAKFVGESAADFAGRSVIGLGDVDNDGNDDIAIAALNEDAGGTNAGAVYIVNGPVGSGTYNLSTADAKLIGEAGSDVFADVAYVGDFDSDGNDDILVGAQGNDTNGSNAGAAYLFLGPVAGNIDASTADAKYTGDEVDDAAGSALSGAGDFNGDGRADLLIGALKDDDGATDAGAVSLILGSASPSDADLSAAAQLKWTGVSDTAGVGQFASVSTAGDVNNDGFADILIGANTESGSVRNAGAAYIILGSSTPGSGTVSLSTADAILTGALENDRAGDSVGPAGDIDNDGNDDIVVGAGYSSYDSDQGGSVYVVTGPVSGTVDLQQAFFHTWVSEDGARAAGRGVGDLDGDGLDDVMMGAWRAGSQTGELHLFFSDGL